MQFPESWLRTLVNPDISTAELSHRLTMAGLEVEETNPVAPAFSGVVVARILSAEPHPNADKLRLCMVDAGAVEPIQIVCGAPNAAAGLKVPLAKVGAKLPGGMEIGVAKMRGVESFGMLCSARELGLSQDHGGLMVLPESAMVGSSIREALNLDDTLFTLKLTPNRADCLSILGVAREVAALTGAELCMPAMQPVDVTLNEVLPVEVLAADLCGRFGGRVLRGVNARASTPTWMVERLERSGQRSVSALVDISNYVMLELGRPTHVFDLDKLAEPKLQVRWGRKGEILTLLNEQTIELDESLGVITSGDSPESLAGIMGGLAVAVSLDTQNIYLEAAFWFPDAIAGRARKLKLNSEASHRFERGVDFNNIPEHIDFITNLIIDVCGGQAGPIDDQLINLPVRSPVNMRLARCCRILGVEVSQAAVEEVFARLGFSFNVIDGVFVVNPPSYRFDIQIEEDLIEEIARMIGFENIPAVPPVAPARMRMDPERTRSAHTLRRQVASLGYQELINFSFVEAHWEEAMCGQSDPIRLLNPIASQLAVMRSSLLPGLIANIRYNANRKQSRVRVFELGRVFIKDADIPNGPLTVAGVDQPQFVALAAWGAAQEDQWGEASRPVDFYDVKHDLEILFGAQAPLLRFNVQSHPILHPGRSASIELKGQHIGWIGELHPRWVQEQELPSAPVLLEVRLDALTAIVMPEVKELSRQPLVQRDLAIWVCTDTPVQALLDTIALTISREPALGVVKDVGLFDVWRDPAKSDSKEKSLAFRVSLQDNEVTLDDARVDACMTMIRAALEVSHQARPR
ncbi:MAG: phenylalanine--tRNA ligase subunit beta [Burkholderiaceae bacterium]|jgi:phenylalanyl-tRNA synthetase beta chain|nr:phenylalanine--tRNA ligase subunit beta [Burkholderiaceae bacterium]MDP4969333.1 phenylalanine--tRNA ligase subunit beta [Burkholderiaceae bacterium]MDP5111253.1 phenylalanine--tRNA ligase subunit beta [Burkholderiaceae bacterium]